ncbi:MAG: APC family permease [Steroidobacteraceae bacterium]
MGIWSKLAVEEVREESLRADSPGSLHRTLGATSLAAFGIGAIVGAGIFVVTGTAAAENAGPAIVLSFVVAAAVCFCPALCYAELAAMIPVSGGPYSYAYVALGELPAWVVGWSLLCEFLFAGATISAGWSSYFVSVLRMVGLHAPRIFLGAPVTLDPARHLHATGAIADFPAALMVLVIAGVLLRGTRASARVNNVIVAVKLAVLLAFIGFGAFYVRPGNWTPFIPPNLGSFGQYGWSGIFRAAGVTFFAFLGFDTVATAAREARNPSRDTPLGIIGSLLACTVLYIAVAMVLTGLSPYRDLAVGDPLIAALQHTGPMLAVLRPLIGVGALIGLTSVMLVLLFAQSRTLHAMAHDGLLPPSLGRVQTSAGVPALGIAAAAIATAILGALLPIELLSELISIAALFNFVAVCATALVLRRMQPSLPRPFRAPHAALVAGIGAVACAYLMVSLPLDTWLGFCGWMLGGIAIYCGYGRRRSIVAGGEKRIAGAELHRCRTNRQ